LNRHGFETGNAQPPYFVSTFPDYVLPYEFLRGYKVPKFSKYAGELEESTVEHVAHFQIKCGDLASDEFLKMKYFPSSLTRNTFTWFTILLLSSIYTWTQLKRMFHEHFFKGKTKASLIDLVTIECLNNEIVENYLNRFQQLKSRFYTQIPEHELVRMTVVGLDFSIRKKLVNQQVRDMA